MGLTRSTQLTLALDGKHYAVDLAGAHDISLPVRFDQQQISVFGAPPATTTPMISGEFIGSVAQGGSCNCGIHAFSPHTAGTHTECVGHITLAPITICETLHDSLIPATLITLTPVLAQQSSDTYSPDLRSNDNLLTAKAVTEALHGSDPSFHRALVVRTTPNSLDKKCRNYDADPPGFFSTEAMLALRDCGVEHLLVDLPSLDRLDDEGRLCNHRVFWSVLETSHSAPVPAICSRTVTELIYVPESVPDGVYLLNLQVAPLLADAAPSRPILYPVHLV